MSLDPNDPRPPYQQVASVLRAAILTKKYAPGMQLPSGNELARQFGVARMTIQQSIRILREEGLVVSRQGQGVFVRERAESAGGLLPTIGRAFERDDVAIDFAGLSGETLHGALQGPIEKIRTGRLTPQRVSVRILVPDTSIPWVLPARASDHEDEPRYRRRVSELSSRFLGSIGDDLSELAAQGLLKVGRLTVRTHALTPLFKLYLINDEDMFFGFYPVYTRTLDLEGQGVDVFELGGKDTKLLQHTATDDEDDPATNHVAQGRAWFDSVWSTIAKETSP